MSPKKPQNSPDIAYLVIRDGKNWSDVFRLMPGRTATIGRSTNSQIVIKEDQASRQHAEIFARLPNGSTFVDAIVGNSVRGGNGIGLPLNQANLRSVALVRFDPEQGKAIVTKLNAKDAIYGDPTQNPPLRDNDVIVVGRNFINRITFAIDTITRCTHSTK